MLEEKTPPRFQALRRFLFHNFWLKLLAFVLAVLIYLMLREGINVQDNEYFKEKQEKPEQRYNMENKLANAER